MTTKDVCPECMGEQFTWGGLVCWKCDGTGKAQNKGEMTKDERRKGIFNAIESAKFTMEHATLTGTDIKVTNVEPCEATEAVIRFLEEE